MFCNVETTMALSANVTFQQIVLELSCI